MFGRTRLCREVPVLANTCGCHHCVDCPEDMEQTEDVCPAWTKHRCVVVNTVSGGNILGTALDQTGRGAWKPSFYVAVILAKETCEGAGIMRVGDRGVISDYRKRRLTDNEQRVAHHPIRM